MCGHTFTWMSVLPPSHCPVCGACLHCGQPRTAPLPYYHWTVPNTYPINPWWESPYRNIC